MKVTIDFENISQRILALPIPAKNYVAMFAGKTGGLILADQPSDSDSQGPPMLVVTKFDLAKRKVEPLIAGIQNLDVPFNGEKFLYQQGDDWFIASTAQAAKPSEGKLKLGDVQVWVDPRAEWKQIHGEVWRIDFDPHAWREGHDPQLEKAVELTLQQLEKNPPQPIKRPAFPNDSKYSSVH